VVGCSFTLFKAFLRVLIASLHSSLNQEVLCFVTLDLLLGIDVSAIEERMVVKYETGSLGSSTHLYAILVDSYALTD